VVSEIQLPMEYVNEILKFLTCYMRGNLWALFLGIKISKTYYYVELSAWIGFRSSISCLGESS
jgi:uncharacterized membrane protein